MSRCFQTDRQLVIFQHVGFCQTVLFLILFNIDPFIIITRLFSFILHPIFFISIVFLVLYQAMGQPRVTCDSKLHVTTGVVSSRDIKIQIIERKNSSENTNPFSISWMLSLQLWIENKEQGYMHLMVADQQRERLWFVEQYTLISESFILCIIDRRKHDQVFWHSVQMDKHRIT